MLILFYWSDIASGVMQRKSFLLRARSKIAAVVFTSCVFVLDFTVR